jgi:NAD(P)-dependent dehydrogenase (short-subunit alcohol dehydrogenase family)
MKCVLVTGATKGIGLAISAKLVDKGYYVYMNYAHDDVSAESLRFPEGMCCTIKADLTTISGMDALIDMLLCTDGGLSLDSIVFNVGLTYRRSYEQVEYEEWDQVMTANVKIPFFITQKLREFISDSGSIIFIGAGMGIYPHAISIPYSVSKAGVHMLARSLVKEFAIRNIRVNVLAPGFVDTEGQKEKPEWLRKKIENKIALKRFATTDEIADACMNLMENTYINGAVLQIDGGYNME